MTAMLVYIIVAIAVTDGGNILGVPKIVFFFLEVTSSKRDCVSIGEVVAGIKVGNVKMAIDMMAEPIVSIIMDEVTAIDVVDIGVIVASSFFTAVETVADAKGGSHVMTGTVIDVARATGHSVGGEAGVYPSYCCVVISCVYYIQMRTSKIGEVRDYLRCTLNKK